MKRSFKHSYSPSAVLHIYQRSIDKGVIFYTPEDRLVYCTVAATKARKHNVMVSAAAIMFTHIHHSVKALSLNSVENYLHDTDTAFAMMYNNRYQRKGCLFQRAPGMSLKSTSKSIRSNLVYVFNNHVEKGLCRRAVEERWSFLPYAISQHPFSAEINRNTAGKVLRKSMNLVDRRVNKCQNLSYSDLDKILTCLDDSEKEQFVDYVIWKYAWVDFSLARKQFGSTEALIVATDSTSGGEYDIHEEYSRDSDVTYRRLIKYAEIRGVLLKVYSADPSERADMAVDAHRRIGASLLLLKKFYHI